MDSNPNSVMAAALPVYGPPLSPQSRLVSALRSMHPALAYEMFGRLNSVWPERTPSKISKICIWCDRFGNMSDDMAKSTLSEVEIKVEESDAWQRDRRAKYWSMWYYG